MCSTAVFSAQDSYDRQYYIIYLLYEFNGKFYLCLLSVQSYFMQIYCALITMNLKYIFAFVKIMVNTLGNCLFRSFGINSYSLHLILKFGRCSGGNDTALKGNERTLLSHFYRFCIYMSCFGHGSNYRQRRGKGGCFGGKSYCY